MSYGFSLGVSLAPTLHASLSRGKPPRPLESSWECSRREQTAAVETLSPHITRFGNGGAARLQRVTGVAWTSVVPLTAARGDGALTDAPRVYANTLAFL